MMSDLSIGEGTEKEDEFNSNSPALEGCFSYPAN
jgi:hypothetical protein